jgi:hypothetical protein
VRSIAATFLILFSAHGSSLGAAPVVNKVITNNVGADMFTAAVKLQLPLSYYLVMKHHVSYCDNKSAFND